MGEEERLGQATGDGRPHEDDVPRTGARTRQEVRLGAGAVRASGKSDR